MRVNCGGSRKNRGCGRLPRGVRHDSFQHGLCVWRATSRVAVGNGESRSRSKCMAGASWRANGRFCASGQSRAPGVVGFRPGKTFVCRSNLRCRAGREARWPQWRTNCRLPTRTRDLAGWVESADRLRRKRPAACLQSGRARELAWLGIRGGARNDGQRLARHVPAGCRASAGGNPHVPRSPPASHRDGQRTSGVGSREPVAALGRGTGRLHQGTLPRGEDA